MSRKNDKTALQQLLAAVGREEAAELLADRYGLDIDDPGEAPAGSPVVDWKTFEETRYKAEVLRFLQKTGWEVRKQTFYNHCGEGKLGKNRNGLYTRRLVKKYAETWLVRTATGQTVTEEAENLLAEKTREEISRIRIIKEREQFDLDTKRGKYLPRADVEAQLAGRAVMMDNGLTHLIQSAVADIIALVAGDQQRSAELVAFLVEKKDQLLNEYATMGQFQVEFYDDDEA